jgi:hypothetical protein
MIRFVHKRSLIVGDQTCEGNKSFGTFSGILTSFRASDSFPGKWRSLALLAVGIAPLGSLTAGASSIQSFVYSQGDVTFITAPGGGYTYAEGINNNGVIWGQQILQTGSNTAANFNFIESGGTFTQLNVPGASETSVGSINESGQIAGSYTSGNVDGNYMPEHPYFYDGSTFTTLNEPACPPVSCIGAVASGINDEGEIVGSYTNGNEALSSGFIYSNGIFTTVQAPGATDTGLSGVNDHGLIVGNEFILEDSRTEGFVDSGGVFTTIDVPGSSEAYASSVNNSGVVVGTYVGPGGLSSGFVYSDGTYATFDLPGATDTYLGGINDQGDMVGYTYTAPPVPEPNSLILFITGFSCIAGLGFRRFRAT